MSAPGTKTPRTLALRMPLPRGGAASELLSLRSVLVCAALAVLTAAATFAALMLGEVTHTPAEVAETLFGGGSGSAELFIVQWRLPRAVSAAVFGAMLGMSGALFQCITRNPLGSPDVIGFTAGASVGGVAVVAFVGSGYYLIAGGALTGGFAVAAIIVLLARGGGVAGFRLVIAGIAVSAMLASLETWFVLSAELELAQVAALWSTGSLNGSSFSYGGPALIAGVILLLVTGLGLGRRLSLLDLGEDVSASLGASPERTRLLAIAAGVLLVGLVTAAAGPIAFVALAAPHIGRRLAGSAGTALAPSAFAGALLLSTADLAGQHAIPGQSYPVGLVTVAVGGVYLITLIVRENRKGTL